MDVEIDTPKTAAIELPTFPVQRHLSHIERTVDRNAATIIVAPTGSGKSTCIGDHLEKILATYSKKKKCYVIVAVPRRVLAWSIATFVASRRHEEVGKSVGYHTGQEKCFSEDTRVFFVTDGLQEIRELLGHTRFREILIIDELHEWNIRQEILLAEAKRALNNGQLSKLIVMSATMKTDRLSAYLNSAPVLKIPGSMFKVAEYPRYNGPAADLVEQLLRDDKKTLVFLPGKREIRALISELRRRELDAVLLPLHGEQSEKEQQKCFSDYNKPLGIFATEIAQSGVTVPGVRAIVDSGQVRLSKVIGGIEGLYTDFMTVDDYLQRLGRGGRTCDSEYHPLYDRAKLARYPKPEIKRLLLETTVLRIKAFTGRDIEGLDLFHAPPSGEVARAKKRLLALGCMTDKGNVTEIGREVALLPVSPPIGTMLLHARSMGVLDDAIIIAAIVEAGGITEYSNTTWQELFCPNEVESDVMAQLLVFKAAVERMNTADDNAHLIRIRKELEDDGINLLRLDQAIEKRTKIAESIRSCGKSCSPKDHRNNLLTAIRTGFGGHYFIKAEGGWHNGDGVTRTLEGSSIIPRDSNFIVGIPWNIDITNSEPGENTLFLIRMATTVSKADLPGWLLKHHRETSSRAHKERSVQGKKQSGQRKGKQRK